MESFCEELLQKMQRDINCLSDHNKSTRRRSLEKIHKELLSDSNRHVLYELLNNGLMKVLLKSFSDSMERCRSIAISTVSKCIAAVPSPVPFLPLIIPVVVSRFASQEECEPSEEIRLSLVECLNLLVDISGVDIAPYTHDFITILRISVVDPYPEVKKESCKCCSKLAKTVPHVFHQEGELLSKPLLQSMTHQHSKVRTACVEAFGNIVQYGSATSINDGLPVLAQRICDSTASVRLTTVKVVGSWLLDLGDRYSYHHKLIPLLLTGFSDEVLEIGLLSQELWNKIGIKYGEENEQELKDQLDFSKPKDPFPELGFMRPILGCRVLVYRSFSKILPAILKDVVDWTVNSRIKSSQLLATLLFHLEEQMTHHLQGIIHALYRTCQDEELMVSCQAIKAAQLIGFYVPIDVWCHLILPAVGVSAGCSSRGQSSYHESSIAVGPYHCTGCLMVLANLLRGYSLKPDLQVDVEYLKDIGGCLNQPEVGQTDSTNLLQQLLLCVEAVVSVATRAATVFPGSLSLDLFSVILKINADHRTTFYTEIDTILKMLSDAQGLADPSLLYLTHIRRIIDSVKENYKSWSILSQECGMFVSVVSGQMAGNALATVLADVIPIFSFCTSHNRIPEMQLRFITILIEIIMSSSNCSELADQLNIHSLAIISTVFVPACVWRGGRTAAAIRTAALTGVQALLVTHCLTSHQISSTLQELLSQVLSSLDDDNFSTRKVACRIMKLLLKDSAECFKVEQLHELFCDLSKRLDDNSDEIRMETIETLLFYYKAFPIDYNTVLYNAHVEMMYKGLLIHLDDPSTAIQAGILSVLVEASRLNSTLLSSMTESVRSKHRTTEYCDKILSLLQHK